MELNKLIMSNFTRLTSVNNQSNFTNAKKQEGLFNVNDFVKEEADTEPTIESENTNNKHYYEIIDGNIYYFDSCLEYNLAKIMTKKEKIKNADGCIKNEIPTPETINSAQDAVIMLEGNKSDYYVDVDGIRYYYNSLGDLFTGAFSNRPVSGSIGCSQVIEDWGHITNFSITYEGYTYYFDTAEDRDAAQEMINKGSIGMLNKYRFDKYLVGQSKS